MKTPFAITDRFVNRHIGINREELAQMLEVIGVESLDQLVDETIPAQIRLERELDLPEALSEYEYLGHLKAIAAKNKVFRSYIGQGYYGTITPSPILRNIFHNPGWYTSYTPYQAEISQGRLEALLNFQTMVSDLTALPIANASLLDEGTAAAEAMSMFFGIKNKRAKDDLADEFFVDEHVYEHTKEVIFTRAQPLGVKVVVGRWQDFEPNDRTFGVLLQYPNSEGAVEDYTEFAGRLNEAEIYLTVASDLLSLALLAPPGEWGADAVVGNSQRFGIPMGYGGPHAAFFATKEAYKRQIPGRIIGVSVDAAGNQGLRMALQTREQHIRREKATSNICTAQALLATMAGMYAVYHGPKGIRAISERVHRLAHSLKKKLEALGYHLRHQHFFDTLFVEVKAEKKEAIRSSALRHEINFFYTSDGIQISLDESTTEADLAAVVSVFSEGMTNGLQVEEASAVFAIPENLQRRSEFLTHPIFNTHHTETKLMRYIKRLENKDISLVHSMISLGSCTMKLNAVTQLLPVSWPEFADLHPFAPLDQTEGYQQIFRELEDYLNEITGFAGCSLQPNSGAQGEYAGLMTIRAYHHDNGGDHRDVALIPASAHGTNPASAVMAGMRVVVVKTDDHGNIDVDDLRVKAEEHSDNLAALMVTYPSTHGVFESAIKEVCNIIHEHGGMVYMDGANMNAQVGLTSPGEIHADVCHLNLHKTFSIPHGGGGPGMGPICANETLAHYLPSHIYAPVGGDHGVEAVASAPWGSASILLISHAYIRLLGKTGVRKATEYAILTSNYLKARLENEYQILYVGDNGRVAHEFIVDLRPFKPLGISAEDVAKRLIDYGFHAPTLSFPVAGTIMVEPTESEDKEELDRFCEAMLQIKKEIDEIATGAADAEENLLHNAPHTAIEVTADKWEHAYSREKAAYPLPYLREHYKYWVPVKRIDNAYGDRHLICTCPPIESYEES